MLAPNRLIPGYALGMSERKTRVTVTIDPGLAAYAERLVESGKADSFSAVVNRALAASVEEDRRVARRWQEALDAATDADRAKAARILARIDEHEARLADRGAR
jgi:Arc/MetJ-type ribon-helix-helix transcriptional regulator